MAFPDLIDIGEKKPQQKEGKHRRGGRLGPDLGSVGDRGCAKLG